MSELLVVFIRKFAALADTFTTAKTMPITANTIMYSSPVFTFERLFFQNNPEDTPFSFSMLGHGADQVLKEFSIDQSAKIRVINIADVQDEDFTPEFDETSKEGEIFKYLSTLSEEAMTKIKESFVVQPVNEEFKLFEDGKQLLLQANDLYVLGKWCEHQKTETMPCKGVLAVNFYLDSFFRGKREALNEIFRLSNLVYYKEMLQSGEGMSFLAYMKQKEQELVEENVLTCLFAQYILGVLYGADLGVKKSTDLATLLFKHVIDSYTAYANFLGSRTGECLTSIPQARSNLYMLEVSAENVQSLCEGVLEEKNDWCAFNLFKNHKEAIASHLEDLISEMDLGNHCLYLLEKAEDIYKKQEKMNFFEMLELFEKAAMQGHPTAFLRAQFCYKEGAGTDPNSDMEKMFGSLYAKLKGFTPKPFLAQNSYPTTLQSVEKTLLRRVPLLPIVLSAIPESLEKYLSLSLDYFVSEEASPSIQYFLSNFHIVSDLNNNLELIVKELEKKATEFKLPEAFLAIGYAYRAGNGVEQSSATALEWFKKAAEFNLPLAIFETGYSYDIGGDDLEQDFNEAMKWYLIAANEHTLDLAFNNIGALYYNGERVDQDYTQAANWYKKAADLGNDVALNTLGKCYYNGQGVKQDIKKAFLLLKDAADGGNTEAQLKVAEMYENGEGTKQNSEKAEYYRGLASEEEEDQAQDVEEDDDEDEIEEQVDDMEVDEETMKLEQEAKKIVREVFKILTPDIPLVSNLQTICATQSEAPKIMKLENESLLNFVRLGKTSALSALYNLNRQNFHLVVNNYDFIMSVDNLHFPGFPGQEPTELFDSITAEKCIAYCINVKILPTKYLNNIKVMKQLMKKLPKSCIKSSSAVPLEIITQETLRDVEYTANLFRVMEDTSRIESLPKELFVAEKLYQFIDNHVFETLTYNPKYALQFKNEVDGQTLKKIVQHGKKKEFIGMSLPLLSKVKPDFQENYELVEELIKISGLELAGAAPHLRTDYNLLSKAIETGLILSLIPESKQYATNYQLAQLSIKAVEINQTFDNPVWFIDAFKAHPKLKDQILTNEKVVEQFLVQGHFSNDEEFAKKCITLYPTLYKYFSESIRQDKTLSLIVINHIEWSYVIPLPQTLRNNFPFMEECMEQDIRYVHQLGNNLNTNDSIIKPILESNIHVLPLVNSKYWRNKDYVLEFIQSEKDTTIGVNEFVGFICRNFDIEEMKTALEENGMAQYLAMNYSDLTDNVYTAALEEDKTNTQISWNALRASSNPVVIKKALENIAFYYLQKNYSKGNTLNQIYYTLCEVFPDSSNRGKSGILRNML